MADAAPAPSHSPAASPVHAARGRSAARGGLAVSLPPRHPRSGASRAQITPKPQPSPAAAAATSHRPAAVSALPAIVTPRTIPVQHSPDDVSITVPSVSSLAADPSSLDRVSLRSDFLLLLRLAVPSSAIFLVQFLIGFSSMLFVGRLGKEYLGAAALAQMLANLTGFSIGQGATTALDALCSQAYGAKSYALVGRHAQRAMVMLTIACVPVAFIWWQTGRMLGWMGVGPLICDLAERYTRVLIGGMWANFQFECLRRYLQAQCILWPIVVSAAVTLCASILLNYLFMFQFDLGFHGPPIASAASQWVMLLTIVACIWGRNKYRSYRGRMGMLDQAATKAAGRARSKARRKDGETYASIGSANSDDLASPRAPDDNGSDGTVACMSPPPALSPQSPESGWSSPTAAESAHMLTHRQPATRFDSFPDPHSMIQIGAVSVADEDDLASPRVHHSLALSSSSFDTLGEWVDPEDSWPSMWSREVLVGWSEFLKLALPGAASLFIEWGSYEIAAAMAARLGEANLAVHSIFMQTAGLAYMVPMGIATACSISIGQYLGAGRGDRARDITRLGLMLHVVFPLLCGAVLLFFLRNTWSLIFTSDQDVADICSSHLPIMALYFFFDHVKCVCMAVLRGCGRAPVTVWGNCLSCWIVGFPLAYLLVVSPGHLELWGLWTAMSAAWATASAVYCIVIVRTDWNQEVMDAKQRTLRSLQATAELQQQQMHNTIQEEEDQNNKDRGHVNGLTLSGSELELQRRPVAVSDPHASSSPPAASADSSPSSRSMDAAFTIAPTDEEDDVMELDDEEEEEWSQRGVHAMAAAAATSSSDPLQFDLEAESA